MSYSILEIELLEPVIIGKDVMNDSYGFISGTALKGVFIKECFKKEKAENMILNKDIVFYDAYLKLDGKYFLPTPMAYTVSKHDLKSLSKENPIKEEINNFLGKRKEIKSPVNLNKPYSFYENKTLLLQGIKKVDNIHINKKIQDEYGEGENSIFRYEAIKAGQKFYALVKINDDKSETKKIFQEIFKENEEKVIQLGKSRSSGYGKSKLKNVEEIIDFEDFKNKYLKIENKSNGKYIDIYFYTRTIIKDEFGNTTSFIPERELANILFETNIKEEDLKNGKEERVKLVKSIVKISVVGGYNPKWQMALPKDTCIEAGSILRYEINETIDKDKLVKKLKELEDKGIGYMRERGFGRIITNPQFDIEKISVYEKQDDKKQEFKILDSGLTNMYENILGNVIEKRIENTMFKGTKILEKIKSNTTNNQLNNLITLINEQQQDKEVPELQGTKDKVFNDREKISISGKSSKEILSSLKGFTDLNTFIKDLKLGITFEKEKQLIEESKAKINEFKIAKTILKEMIYYEMRGRSDVQ